VFRSRPVRVIVIREPRHPELALVTTDPTTAAEQVIERSATRWAIEVAFADAKQIIGVGEARNRTIDTPRTHGLCRRPVLVTSGHTSSAVGRAADRGPATTAGVGHSPRP
jgi:hypothetical protein